jgi:tmRNA-binding protein
LVAVLLAALESCRGKVEIALARGRRSFDKRQAIAQGDADREIAREFSGRRRRACGPN